MPLVVAGLVALIAVVALLRFNAFAAPIKLLRYLGIGLLGLLTLFFALTERWIPAVFLAGIGWSLYTGGRALPRDWTSTAPDPEPASPPRTRSTMARDEALKVLGLDAGATADDVRAAHRRLIQQNHPDKGGSDYLASKINEAKDVLLSQPYP
jgi:hypothetical protein